MTVEELLAWDPGGQETWQLVDGQPHAMAPPSPTHGRVQTRVTRLMDEHLERQGGRCAVVTTPGVLPRVQADQNIRVPDLAVTCGDPDIEGAWIVDPTVIVEILSPSNKSETWANVWAYTTIPSVQEILVLSSMEIWAKVLRRGLDGAWPENAEPLTEGDLELGSIGFRHPLADLYRNTRLRRLPSP